MMKKRCINTFFVITLLIAGLPGALHAQEPDPPEIRIIHVAPDPQEDSLEVSVFFDIVDAQGNPLPKEAVEIESTTIQMRDPSIDYQAVPEDPQTPIHVALLLDESGSMSSAMPAVREAAKASLEYAPQGDHTYFGVFGFAEMEPDDPFIPLQPFTNDPTVVRNAIDLAESTPGAGTCLFYATSRAIDVLNERITDPQDRRAIILFTDGKDELLDQEEPCSKNFPEENVIAKATSPSQPLTPIYTIGLCTDANCTNINLDVLQRLANETSASFEYGQIGDEYGQIGDVNAAFGQIMTDLNSQWVARANIAACREDGANPRGTLWVKLRGTETELSTGFEVPFDDCINPRPEAAIEFVGPTEEASHNYSGELVINSNHRQIIDTIRVQIFNEDGVRVGSEEYIYADYGHAERVPINIDMSNQPPGEYIIRFYADTESGETVRNPADGSELGERGFVHVLPAEAESFQVAIRPPKPPDYETMTFDAELEIQDPDNQLQGWEMLPYEWWLVKEGTEVERGTGNLDIAAGSEYIIPITIPEMMLDVTRAQQFTLFVDIKIPQGPGAPVASSQFNLDPPEQQTWLQRFLGWIADYLLYIGIAIGLVILLVLVRHWQRTRKSRQDDELPPEPAPPTGFFGTGNSGDQPGQAKRDPLAPETADTEPVKETTIFGSDMLLKPVPVPIKLTVRYNHGPHEEVVRSFPCVIGRADDSEQYKDVTFRIVANHDSGVSRRHLKITWDDESGQFSVTDLGSGNGTFIYKQNAASDSQIAGSHPTTITDWERLPANEARVLDGHTILQLGPTIRLELEPQQVPGPVPSM
jgi:hypothetical protein